MGSFEEDRYLKGIFLMLFYGSFCEVLTLAVSFKENMAGPGQWQVLVMTVLRVLDSGSGK